jgi:hypothetical protein
MGGNPRCGFSVTRLSSCHVSRAQRRAAGSVALLSVGVIVVTAGLATMRLSLIGLGVIAFVGGWVTAAGVESGGHKSLDR